MLMQSNQILAFLAHPITTEIGIKACTVTIDTNAVFWYRGWQYRSSRSICASVGGATSHDIGEARKEVISGK